LGLRRRGRGERMMGDFPQRAPDVPEMPEEPTESVVVKDAKQMFEPGAAAEADEPEMPQRSDEPAESVVVKDAKQMFEVGAAAVNETLESGAAAVNDAVESVKAGVGSKANTHASASAPRVGGSESEGAASYIPKINLPVAATKTPATLKDVLMWRNPYLTGIIFGTINVIFMLTLFGGYSLLRVFSSAMLFYLIMAFIVVNLSKVAVGFTGKELIPKPTLGHKYIRKEVWIKYFENTVNFLNHFIDAVRKALYCVDNKQTLQLCVILYGLSLIGRIIPDMWLLYLTFLGVFTFPIVYETYEEDIDKALVELKKILEKYYAQGKEQVAKQGAEMQKTVEKKMGDLKKQVQEKSGPMLENSEIAAKLGLSPGPAPASEKKME